MCRTSQSCLAKLKVCKRQLRACFVARNDKDVGHNNGVNNGAKPNMRTEMMTMLIFVNDKIVHNLELRCDIQGEDKEEYNWGYDEVQLPQYIPRGITMNMCQNFE